jgi:ubiquitin-like modifier-activating enzyme ATG7
VARCLLGYGARRLTLLDNGTVSFSNPTRQSLFEHQDACAGSPKAAAAAAALQRIYPAAEADGVQLTIPSPGCAYADDEAELVAALADADALDALIGAADVVFLLTDTRESRWLPTLVAKVRGVLAVTAAIGFDSYLVMRRRGGADDDSCCMCSPDDALLRAADSSIQCPPHV